MALVDERNQDDRGDVIEENDDRSEQKVAHDGALADTDDDKNERESDEGEESDEDDPVIP